MKNTRIPKDSRIPTMKYSRKNRTWAWQFRRSKMRGRICFRPAALWPIEIHKELRKSDYINSSENTHQIGRAAAVNSCSVPMNAIWDLLNHAIKRVDPLKLSELIKSQAATTKHHHFRRMVPMILRNQTWNSDENSEFMILSIPHACCLISACEAIQISVFHF